MYSATSGTSTMQLVSFAVGPENCALEILRVWEIHRVPEITPVPGAPPYVRGIINLRGTTIPILDLRLRMGLSDRDGDAREQRILVVESRGRIAGLLVDRVYQVVRVSSEQLERAANGREGFVQAVVKTENALLSLLNLEAVLGLREETPTPA
ncbi:MAG: chemotaxis protein CheW [Bacteroidetes bacterium]|nr:chemotaxis protein CheW [Rhodothermia bacterium]MCS7154657.1 chemotaxis protein CheW [Bacteroidota bacterium]MCX7906374.1 chemotaxis protein CheW [Bacteroidota bacterium]MDW8137450.1 chemotaxis protein CheW [Bacteroidota bacterium]MDW8285596.1 chemotaxis protein CheW [Bacteroidota bacterium]